MDAATAEMYALCKLLLDEERMQILGMLAQGSRTLNELASELRGDRAAAVRHLKQLCDSALVQIEQEGEREVYRFNSQLVRDLKKRLFARPVPAAQTEPERILSVFLRGERITHLPERHDKMLVVLGWLAERFTPGTQYAERQVNEILQRHYEDHAILRRYLVDNGFLARDHGVYWRVTKS
jgi:hypothetical protein